nr:MAG TPA: hypothetical protein [Caudoviricetes sp.]
MFSNEDNSSIAINVNKGGKGMPGETVSIGISEYKSILELAYKAAMVKEAVLDNLRLDFFGKELCVGGGNEVATIFKYAFPKEYENRLRDLANKMMEDDSKGGRRR